MVDNPYQLVIEPVSICNLKCPYCYRVNGIKRQPFMDMALFDKVIAEAKHYIKNIYLHLWGEPTLHRNIKEMIRKATDIANVDFATNGLFDFTLAETIAMCSTVSVSIDGASKETYAQNRIGGDFDKAIDSLRLLAELTEGKVIWTYIVFRNNEHEIDKARKMAESIGVQIGFKPPYIVDINNQKGLLPVDKRLWRYAEDENGRLKLKADKSKCNEFHETAYVLTNGEMCICCYDYDNRVKIGNVMHSTIKELWNGDAYEALRKDNRNNPVCQDLCVIPS